MKSRIHNCLTALFLFLSSLLFSQNPLFIPDTLSGPVYNLNVQSGITQFFSGQNTPTYGYNGSLLGPTLLMNKGDNVTLNVTNTLTAATTVHWHGLHVPAHADGGPHQLIPPSTTWSPTFKVLNRAATYWYHPHPHGKTELQVAKGLAGMIIVRDSAEASYNLPRRYKVDDFPILIQTKAFDVLYQVAVANHEDSFPMVNGTMNPYLQVPKQVVRFRLLNGSGDRTYFLGLSDSSSFSVIASDGGLLAQPYTTNRLRLTNGERAEILIDFSNDPVGTQKYLMSYSSELPKGIIGADSVGTSNVVIQEGYYSNPLNGLDFNLLRFDVVAATANPVTSIPSAFAPVTPIPTASASVTRTIYLSPDTVTSGLQGFVDGPFLMNGKTFHMDSIDQVIYLNDVEIWSLVNETMVAHPLHIHDIQFFVVDRDGNPPPPEEAGLKDVVLVKPGEIVRFITKFEDFADDSVPYMYHCHLLHHEDDGMMQSFVVIDTTASGVSEIELSNTINIFPNPSAGKIQIQSTRQKINRLSVINMLGETVERSTINSYSSIIDLTSAIRGIYFVRAETERGSITKKIVLLK